MPETDHKDKRYGSGKYLLPIATIVITLIAIAVRFVCVSERARNASPENTVEYVETVVVTEEPSEEPIALPEAPIAPTVKVQTQELITTDISIPQVGPGESLIIPLSDITATVSFLPVEIDGTEMEIIALRDSEGNVRTAFNTCQVCYSSGRGYYRVFGNRLVCQNCGNRFALNDVGIVAGGCNPWPILPSDRIESDDAISIPYSFLAESKALFSRWKTFA